MPSVADFASGCVLIALLVVQDNVRKPNVQWADVNRCYVTILRLIPLQ